MCVCVCFFWISYVVGISASAFHLTVLLVLFSELCVGVVSHPEPYLLKCTSADRSRNCVLSTHMCGVHEPCRVIFLEVRYGCSRSGSVAATLHHCVSSSGAVLSRMSCIASLCEKLCFHDLC